MQHELLPCPFCGGEPTIEPWHGGAPTKVMIICPNREYDDEDGGCSVGPTVTGETPDEAYRRWNRRAASPLPSSSETEWMPIETAPKDGTRIILLLSTGTGRVVHVGYKDQRPNSGWHIEPNGYWSSVTHWLPLPPAPLSPEKGGE